MTNTQLLTMCLAVTAVTCMGKPASLNAAAKNEVLDLVGQHRALWNEKPGRTPANVSVDGPLMGNGDMKVAVGGAAEEQVFYLAKNDLWRLQCEYGKSSPVGFGDLAIRIPQLKGATYKQEQRWDIPETAGTFKNGDITVKMRSRVAATQNLFVLELEVEGGEVDAEAVLRVASGRGSMSTAENRDGVLSGQRAFLEDVDIPSGVAVACKLLGAEAEPSASGDANAPVKMQSYSVQIGREQLQGGRWGFNGVIDDLRVYGSALSKESMALLAKGGSVEGSMHSWSMDEPVAGNSSITVVPGKIGKAWQFSGEKGSFFNCGKIELPVEPVTLACWIKIESADNDANYILSCGEWNHGVSLGLSGGKLRFTVAGQYVESKVLPVGEWIHVGGSWDGSVHHAYVNGQEVGSAGSAAAQSGLRFRLSPGKPVTLVLAMESLLKNKSYVEAAAKQLQGIKSVADLASLRRDHTSWWADYWARSWVQIGDPELEKAYYRSLYHMGACSRDPRFPPGIFGWVTTDNTSWSGDYHLNYNFVAPFYALYSANRIEQGDPEDAPILDFIEQGRWFAKNVTGTRGVLYPVGIGPLGIDTTRDAPRYKNSPNVEKGGLFWQQRSNSAYSLVNIAQRWRTTYDPEYAKKVYPFVREVALFWEDYLVWRADEGRYVILGDAIHEGSGQDMNPILSLGLVRNALDLALEMSTEVNADSDHRKKWQHILQHLSSWSTQEMKGKTVFRYTEKGTAWWGDNTLGVQHIYPGNGLGLDSDTRWLEVAHNTIDAMQRWNDNNGSNSFFPAAVRVGYDAKVILEKLRGYSANTYPNGFMKGNPHGIENQSTVPNTINEMLCMSHVPVGAVDRDESVIRVFPVWPRDKDARFVNIRTWGAFLVSSELKDGEVQQVAIISERGRECTVVNPWPGRKVSVSGRKKFEGERCTFKTKPGETLTLKPE